MLTSVYVSVKVKYTTQMSTVVSLICLGPSFQKMTHHFLLHGSLLPINLEKIFSPGDLNKTFGNVDESYRSWNLNRNHLNQKLII